MPRIENTLMEDAVADSLVEPLEPQPVETDAEHGDSVLSSGLDLLNEAIEEQETSHLTHGDEVATQREQELAETRAQREEEMADWRSRMLSPEEAQELSSQREKETQSVQSTERTPQELEQGIQALESTVQQYGLNDPESAKSLTDAFCSAFGTDAYTAGANVEAMGSVAAKAALSAAQIYLQTGGDVSKVGAIPEYSANAFTRDFLAGFGVDSRQANVDAMALARTVFGGALNVIDSYTRTGISDVTKLNDPQSAELYANSFMAAFGVPVQLDRATALKLADAFSGYVLSKFQQVLQHVQQQQPEQKATGSRKSAQPRVKGGRIPNMKSNTDIFDRATMDYYKNQHGKL